jgi:hypothetical protein
LLVHPSVDGIHAPSIQFASPAAAAAQTTDQLAVCFQSATHLKTALGCRFTESYFSPSFIRRLDEELDKETLGTQNGSEHQC